MTKAVELAQVASTGVSEAFKNRIINGAMVIDQRNAGTYAAYAAGSYIVDRFLYTSSQASKLVLGQNLGVAPVTPPAGFVNYLGAQSQSAYTVGASEIFAIIQVIEGYNIADLGWGTANAQTITLSFWVRSSLTGTFGGALNNGGSRSYPFTYTISSANTWTKIAITIPGDTSGTWGSTNLTGVQVWFSLGIGSNFSGTAGAWAAGFYGSATGATSVVGTNGATFYITGVQLEVGSTATSFDYRPYTTELQLCQRYLPAFRATASTYDYIAPVFSAGGTGLWVTFQFLVTARVPPTGITSSGMSTFSALIGGTQYTTSAATLTSVRSTNGALVEFTGTPPTAGYGGFFRFDNSGTGYIYFTGCEL